MFSAWALVIVSTSLIPAIQKIRNAAYRHRYIGRYLTDVSFKTRISLYGSLAANTLYAGMKFILGAFYGSVWFITLAVYYLFLAVMRFLLLVHINRETIGQNPISEWKRYRLCGILLLMMTIALNGIVILVLLQDENFSYPGYLIYVMAAYAFYSLTMAVINVVNYRKLGSPVLSAAKIINLSAALVSMLALETAMISQFGSADDASFRWSMTGATGAGACLLVMGMAVYMICRSAKQLRALREKGKL